MLKNFPLFSEIQETLHWLIKIEEFSQARELALVAKRYMPQDHPLTTDFMAKILHKTKHYKEAVEWALKTVALAPDQLEARYNLASCLNSAGQVARAEKEIKRVVEAQPDWLDPQLNLAMYICAQGRFDESEQLILNMQKRYPPNDVHQDVIKFNLAWHSLRRGDLKEGMAALMVGRKFKKFGAANATFPKPKVFKGLPLSGKKVLIVGEAGAGDEMINARYAQILKARGANCIWSTGHKLEGLLSRVDGIEDVITSTKISQISYDYWAPSMDLFTLLDLDLKDLPVRAYLSANPKFVKKWRAKIKASKHLKVGLRWQGNPLYEQDLPRSVPFELFRKFFQMAKTDFYGLQRDSGLEEISASDPIIDLAKELETWEDTAAAISLLDVVVTSCTSIAHLAGALGKKVLLFTPTISYYTWTMPGEKSLWYPDVKLFRQKQFHSWVQESDEIFQELQELQRMQK